MRKPHSYSYNREERRQELARRLDRVRQSWPVGTQVRGESDGFTVTGTVTSHELNLVGAALVIVGSSCFYPSELERI